MSTHNRQVVFYVKGGQVMGKKIVILGGGTGGLVVANRLSSSLSNDHEIVLIDREENHLFNPSLLWVMVGWRNKQQIQKPLSLLQKKGIRFINAEVSNIDFEKRVVATSKEDSVYDYLVVSLGAGTFPERAKGFQEAAHNLYNLSGVLRIRDDIENFKMGKIVILITSKPFKCPAAPYEAALLLCEYFKKNRRDVEIEVVTPELLPMGVAGKEVGNMVVSLLQSRGIRFQPQLQMDTIDSAKREIHFPAGKIIDYDFLIGVPPHGLPPVLGGLPILGESGWVKVNSGTLETDLEHIYALGDVTAIPLPVGLPLPKAGVFAHFQADIVSRNVAAHVRGVSSKKVFDGDGYCFIELGDGRAGYAKGNFYAEPSPVVKLKKPSRFRHWGKVLFERWWLRKWF
jgi:sulfide:quinone oxidoreductase